MTTKVIEVRNFIEKFIEDSKKESEKYFAKEGAFTRKCSLNLFTLVILMMSNSRRTLSVELFDFFNKIDKPKVTKGAFSKARYKLKNIFFEDMFKSSTSFMNSKMNLKKWKGFQICAVDGSTLYLLDGKAITEEFGGQTNQYRHTPMARLGFMVDVLNGICLQAKIQNYALGEDEFARQFLKAATQTQLLIYDRLFPSYELIIRHLMANVHFVMRCKADMNITVMRFVASGKKDEIVEFDLTPTAKKALIADDIVAPKKVKVRLLRIDIGNEEPEILITSLLDKKTYPYSCFKELYNKRWGVETYIGKVKNCFQLQVFTGYKVEAIYQDFYLTLIEGNIQNMLIQECEKDVIKANEGRDFDYAINENVAAGIFKQSIVGLFITKKTAKFVTQIKMSFIANLEPIRPGRSFKRIWRVKFARGRHFTDTNYKRCM